MDKAMGKQGKKGQSLEDCFAIHASLNACREENHAEEVKMRQDNKLEEFHSKIKNAVTRRTQLKNAFRKQNNLITVSFINILTEPFRPRRSRKRSMTS